MALVYRWEMTPNELFGCFRPIPRGQDGPLARQPFAGPKRPLEGTPYTYQLGVSDTSVAKDIAPIHGECPHIPLTGDTRAGVLIYDGDGIIASYIIPGNYKQVPRWIVVRDGYRKKGIATRMIEQWHREVPSVMDASRQPINVVAAKTFIKAHTNSVSWAISQGKPVPQRVKDAVAKGEEYQEILKNLTALEGALKAAQASRAVSGRRAWR